LKTRIVAQIVINTFLDEGYTELDTARMYAQGTTEEASIISFAHIIGTTFGSGI